MIIEMICSPFFYLINGIMALIPVVESIPDYIVDVLILLRKAMLFFPPDVWVMVIANVVFWLTLHFIVSLIKFVLGLIPFLNMGA